MVRKPRGLRTRYTDNHKIGITSVELLPSAAFARAKLRPRPAATRCGPHCFSGDVMQPPADDVQPAGLLLPSHLVRIDGGCEKENSAEESDTKVALVQETDTAMPAMQVEGEEAVENAAPEEETNDIAKLEGGEAGAAPDAAGEVPAGQVNEAPATADADGEETTACAAEASGRSSSLEAPVSQPARIITNSVADVRTYPGLRPHGLSEDEISELFDAVQLMKSKSSNQNFVKHGWQCVYTLRSAGSATRGDMCVIDPRDGQKIFSLVGMRRKLGLEEAMACSMV